MVKIRKRDGRIEDYLESKIVAGARKAGATAKEAAQVAKDVTLRTARQAEVTAEELSTMVVTSLSKINQKASDTFVNFRDNKLKLRKKTT